MANCFRERSWWISQKGEVILRKTLGWQEKEGSSLQEGEREERWWGSVPGVQSQKERLMVSLEAKFPREEAIWMGGMYLCVGYCIMENPLPPSLQNLLLTLPCSVMHLVRMESFGQCMEILHQRQGWFVTKSVTSWGTTNKWILQFILPFLVCFWNIPFPHPTYPFPHHSFLFVLCFLKTCTFFRSKSSFSFSEKS